ncbi:MAG: hypothetical protein IKR94_01580 [Bacteroidales bacterium]|nr:hypothetical protein [Bacteroidales bacterium]
MKKLSLILFLIYSAALLYAQDYYRYDLLNDKSYHSAINYYPDTLKSDTNVYHIDISPLFNIASGRGDNGKHAIYSGNVGVEVKADLLSKLTASYRIYGGFSHYNDYFAALADSIGYIPAGGNFYKNGNNYYSIYHEFDITYHIADYLKISAGKGCKKVGDGYRSLLLSDNNSGMYYFDITAGTGGLQYIFSVNTAKNIDSECSGSRTKYLVYHAFSWNITNYLNIGGFEAVSIMRRDSSGNSKFVDLHYLNPVMFFRPVEYSVGSPDNVLMGVFGKVRYYRKNILYGQVMLDEFNSSFLKAGNDWWAKKFAFQAGARGEAFDRFTYIVEANYIRPFMYSHDNAIRSYSMRSQPLAHPYGANLKEGLVNLRYTTRNEKFYFDLTADVVKTGIDTDSISYGGNILIPYTLRGDDYGQTMLQGKPLTITDLSFTMEYKMKLNFDSKSYILKPFVTFGCYNKDEKCLYFMIGIKNFDLTRFY